MAHLITLDRKEFLLKTQKSITMFVIVSFSTRIVNLAPNRSASSSLLTAHFQAGVSDTLSAPAFDNEQARKCPHLAHCLL